MAVKLQLRFKCKVHMVTISPQSQYLPIPAQLPAQLPTRLLSCPVLSCVCPISCPVFSHVAFPVSSHGKKETRISLFNILYCICVHLTRAAAMSPAKSPACPASCTSRPSRPSRSFPVVTLLVIDADSRVLILTTDQATT